MRIPSRSLPTVAMKIRKLPWWQKDKRQRQGEKIRQFKIGRARAARANITGEVLDPTIIDRDRARYYMQLAALQALAAGVPRPAFAFDPGDVAAVFQHKRDEGPGLWFQLKNGRVFNSSGEPEPADPRAFTE